MAVNTTDGLLMHYSRGTWTTLPLLPHVDLAGVTMVSPDEGWAVGSRFADAGIETGLILHYHAGQWTAVLSPVDAASFSAVAMRSPDDGWIVGDGVHLHYREGAWTQAPGPDDFRASDIALSGADGGLTSGAALSADGHFTAAHLLQLTDGAWLDATPPLPLAALTSVSVNSGGAGWLLAEADNPPGFGGRHGLLLRGDAGGHWSPIEIPRKPLWLPLALLLPFSVVATAALCLAIVYGAVRVFRLHAAKGAAAGIIALLAFLLAILLALEVMQVAALVYPGSLISLQPLLFAVVLAASLAPVLSLLVGGVSLALRIRRALSAH